ncbi:class I SAM-dependent methyltransferase [Chryseobacterium indoltheticum]|uniref:class I SAM-dependent methyltransferase n=1 Tax=Chryseobacterium indoltheticum TaxID=254 RepID=UPI003F495C12
MNLQKLIDIGGGDSNLVDFLLEKEFTNISVLDISSKALEKAKTRLETQAENVDWILTDITEFKTNTEYDIWHDRAAFHFLTEAAHEKREKRFTINAKTSDSASFYLG